MESARPATPRNSSKRSLPDEKPGFSYPVPVTSRSGSQGTQGSLIPCGLGSEISTRKPNPRTDRIDRAVCFSECCDHVTKLLLSDCLSPRRSSRPLRSPRGHDHFRSQSGKQHPDADCRGLGPARAIREGRGGIPHRRSGFHQWDQSERRCGRSGGCRPRSDGQTRFRNGGSGLFCSGCRARLDHSRRSRRLVGERGGGHPRESEDGSGLGGSGECSGRSDPVCRPGQRSSGAESWWRDGEARSGPCPRYSGATRTRADLTSTSRGRGACRWPSQSTARSSGQTERGNASEGPGSASPARGTTGGGGSGCSSARAAEATRSLEPHDPSPEIATQAGAIINAAILIPHSSVRQRVEDDVDAEGVGVFF